MRVAGEGEAEGDAVEGGDAAPPPPSSPPPGYSWEELQEELPLHTRIRVLWEDKDGADEWHAIRKTMENN